MNLDLEKIETELKKRLAFDYQWGQRQNDDWDQLTNFIYDFWQWEAVVEAMKATVEACDLPKRDLFNYAANRWFNFWSAMAVEQIFARSEHVIPSLNRKNRLVDFSLYGVEFDHKTSVFPKGMGETFYYCQKHEGELLNWLYKNQSQEGRKHMGNRLFIVVYAADGEHWKLKAEISWLQSVIEDYLKYFKVENLREMQVENGTSVATDILWAVKE